MRKLPYISNSSLNLFYEDRKAFFLRYLAETSPPREAQTRPMCAGSAFDARIKDFLGRRLLGTKCPEALYFENAFPAQVEAQNRDWALGAAEISFKMYNETGALTSLLLELEGAITEPRFEFTVAGKVFDPDKLTGTEVRQLIGGEMIVPPDEGIPLLGKPDLYFKHKNGLPAVYDWKVNGFAGSSNLSPTKGYIKLHGGKKHGAKHPCVTIVDDGGLLRSDLALNISSPEHAQQLSIYAWFLGAGVCSPFIAGIEQLVGPAGRQIVATHRALVDCAFQKEIYNKIANMWQILESGHIFENLPRDESDEECELLEKAHLAYQDDTWSQMMGRK